MDTIPTGMYLGPERIDEARAFERLLPSVTCTVFRGGWYEFAPGWHVAPRIPTHSIAFLCVDGRAEIRIGEERRRLAPGTVILAPPDVPQELWNEGDESVRMHTVWFSARLYGLLDLPSLCGLPVEYQLSTPQFDEMVAIARRIIQELREREPGYALATNAAGLQLVAALWRAWAASGGEPSLASGAHIAELARLEPVLRAIQSRYAELLTLAQMAQLVHLHPAYFSTLFRRATGLPPSQYLARYRLRRAQELLLSTDHSLSEIAAATGFSDPFYLSRAFRRQAGVSPSAFRKANTGSDLP
jgi:AraC family transcriptional regulator, arabinose operon regulatory protein